MGSTSRSRLLPLVVAALLAAGPAWAVQKVTSTTSDTVTATTATARGRASITLKNDTAVEVTVTVGSEFRHETTQAAVKAEWIKYPLAAEPGGLFKLKPDETATFEVSGVFADAGVYETFVEVRETNAISRYPVRITRTVKAIGADFVLEPKPVRIGLSFSEVVTSSTYMVPLTGRNATGEPVEVATPIVGQLLSGTPTPRPRPRRAMHRQ